MTYEEKGTWLLLVIAIAGYATYLSLLFSAADGGPLVEAPYVVPMLWTIGGAIIAGIVLRILLEIVWRSERQAADVRDKAIDRMGSAVGSAFVTAGALGALALAMLEAPHFWIANTLYLAFVVSGIVAPIAKVIAYRRGLPGW